jgi:hypothetical protein
MTIFGAIVHGGHIEAAALDTLRSWLPTYLAELERQTGRSPGVLPSVRSWSLVARFGLETDDQLPAGMLVSAGLAFEPTKGGAGMYSATWLLDVAVVVSARDEGATRELAMIYCAATRAVILQRPALGGVAAGIDWVDERYDDLSESGRYLAAGRNTFRVFVADVLSANAGPVRPDPKPDPLDPYDETTTVDKADVVVQPKGPQ